MTIFNTTRPQLFCSKYMFNTMSITRALFNPGEFSALVHTAEQFEGSGYCPMPTNRLIKHSNSTFGGFNK